MKVLFVTWDGPQVSYLEGLFLPIFRRLAAHGYEFHVLQFTWGNKKFLQQNKKNCEKSGVPYRSVNVWRRPVSVGSLVTAVKGAWDIRKACREWNIDIVMPRSTLPALATLLAMRRRSTPIVFDADGLPLDERVDFSGSSSSGLIYRLLRDIEAQAVRKASVVLARSSKAIDILYARAGAGTSVKKFHVVSNGRDATLFNPHDQSSRNQVRESLGVDLNSPLLVYAGSLGEQYCLLEMFAIFEYVLEKRSDARFLIMTGSPEYAVNKLASFPKIKEDVIIISVTPKQVSKYLAAADIGLALRKASFSMQAVAPIKLGEYLLCGVPVIASRGIGDTNKISADVGFLLDEISEEHLYKSAFWIVEMFPNKRELMRECSQNIGNANFSLEASIISYLSALRSLHQ